MSGTSHVVNPTININPDLSLAQIKQHMNTLAAQSKELRQLRQGLYDTLDKARQAQAQGVSFLEEDLKPRLSLSEYFQKRRQESFDTLKKLDAFLSGFELSFKTEIEEANAMIQSIDSAYQLLAKRQREMLLALEPTALAPSPVDTDSPVPAPSASRKTLKL